jgi:DNA-binding transcriptional regulator YdaS (Cro superfamily)
MSTNPIDLATELDDDPHLIAVQRVIDLAGGQTKLAEKLAALTGKRMRQSRISMWLFRGRVPPEWVIPCESVLDGEMTRHDIRSDLHPRDHAA